MYVSSKNKKAQERNGERIHQRACGLQTLSFWFFYIYIY